MCDSRTAIVFVSEGSERVKTATLSFKLNHAGSDDTIPCTLGHCPAAGSGRW